MTSDQHTGVTVDVDAAGVAVITLDGPERLNAFSAGTGRALGDAFRRCDGDDDILAVVLTGAGSAFCAGMVADCQAHYTLRHAVGLAVAAELLLTGRTVTGSEAARLGIASRALPAAEVLPGAIEVARDVAVHANPASVAASKRLLWADLGLDAVEREETRAHHLLMGGAGAAEGAAAWWERRAPQWNSKASEIGDPA